MTLKAMEAQLRGFPEAEVPAGLKAKLFAAISGDQSKPVATHPIQRWPGAWGLGAVAAAVLVLALVFVPDYTPAPSPMALIPDINDSMSRYVLADQNNERTDENAITLQWQVVNQNEPGNKN